VKAKRVKGLDPGGPFRENAQRMAAVRIAELWKLGERSEDASRHEAQHDMRIAAKRLRYLFEITEPCFGKPARTGAKVARRLQDVLGEMHDCDVMSERVRGMAASVAVDDPRYVGLEALASYLEARRRVLHRQFLSVWVDLRQTGWRATLEAELGLAG
jgi:CHAD domain-containing protein